MGMRHRVEMHLIWLLVSGRDIVVQRCYSAANNISLRPPLPDATAHQP